MSRLEMITEKQAGLTVEALYRDLERRIVASPPGLCPIDFTNSFIKMCLTQSCGKCVPCRVGLKQITNLFEKLLDGTAEEKTVEILRETAENISVSADCIIGWEAGKIVLRCLEGCEDDVLAHLQGSCTCNSHQPVACVNLCPARVDVPGYIALVREKRYKDAVRLIRHKNPMPLVCAYICEHPCEKRCKRTILDNPVNIRGLKRVAVDLAGVVPAPSCASSTGKKVAVIGGGPGGLSAAYYLALMGHQVTIFEQRKQLGGMLRYGIPNYRLPRKRLEEEIQVILSTGIAVKKEVSVGKDISLEEVRREFDAVYLSIGAHTDKKIGIEGEDATSGLISAVKMLREIGDDQIPDYSGKRVLVVGGGNVAMDVARSAVRLGAESVQIVYRRRKADMTALAEEVEGAEAEGCDVLELMAPVGIEKNSDGSVKGLWVQPQMIGELKGGRPTPQSAESERVLLACDLIVIAIGQDVESQPFEEAGLPVKRGVIEASPSGEIKKQDGMFAGGDCVTGPATVIRAIAAGRVAAANIDEYLGYHHEIPCEVKIPAPDCSDKKPCGRSELGMRDASRRKKDFEPIEYSMTAQAACQESGRCLRCDHFGFGVLRGGREERW